MKRNLVFPAILILIAMIGVGCKKTQSARYLVISEATHFRIQGNGKHLDFPIFAGMLKTEEIARDISLAEYYYKTLSSVYEFKSFTFVDGALKETLIDREGPLPAPMTVYSFEDSSAKLELLLIGFTREKTSYLFRLSDPKGGQVRDHPIDVPAGKSASVGTLYDREHNRGYLISVSSSHLTITKDLQPGQFAEFLKKKNTPRGGEAPEFHPASDQRWMDEIFGAQAIKLPQDTMTTLPDDTSFVAFDAAPQVIGGSIALGQLIKYPESALRDSLEGKVFVTLYVGKSGATRGIKVAKGVRADLDSAAVNAVRAIQFNPAKQGDNPVGAWITIPIVFKIKK